MHLNTTVITVFPWQFENTIQLLTDFGNDDILKQIHDGEGSLGAGLDHLGNRRMRMRTSSHPPDPGIAEAGGMVPSLGRTSWHQERPQESTVSPQ